MQPSTQSGLTEREARERLARDGPNLLPGRDRRGFVEIVVQTLREPMFALLLVGGGVYAAIGDLKEALVLLAFACVSVVIAVVQEFRSERVLAALRGLAEPVSTVIRDGAPRQVPSAELVRGDLVVLAEGERVPADGVLRRGDDVTMDESLLTGESAPVAKAPTPQALALGPPGGEDTPFLYSGSLLVRGEALAEVSATGPRSAIGKLGQSMESIVEHPGRLTLETRRLVRRVGPIAFVVCAAVVLLFGLTRGAWLSGILAGVALGMAMLPEEFPLVLTVFMVMGAWRLSRAKVLTKRAVAIEALGAATVLCSDKTGTLTQNRMTLVAAWADGKAAAWSAGQAIPAAARPLAAAGLMASAPHPFDPMERAIHEACADWFEAPAGLELERNHGLAPGHMAVSQVWIERRSGRRFIASKGAPETIVRLSGLGPEETARVMVEVETMAAQGTRVLGVAEAWQDATWTPQDGAPLTFLGLIGLADPLRPDARQAVSDCQSAGVRVVMITGDYPATAQAIARQAGITPTLAMTGAELDGLSDEALAERASAIGVFARILPEQKLRIVRALQAAGEVVAMTGDGVNDAPALKAADIGIAMGQRGTDVARAAADIVLLDDNFASIVAGIRLGRRIYDNLQKATGFIVAVHAPIAGLALLPLLLGLPIFLAPAHIAFLEMIIDPVCSVVFEVEREEAGIMRRPPRDPRAPLFTPPRVAEGVLQGLVALA